MKSCTNKVNILRTHLFFQSFLCAGTLYFQFIWFCKFILASTLYHKHTCLHIFIAPVIYHSPQRIQLSHVRSFSHLILANTRVQRYTNTKILSKGTTRRVLKVTETKGIHEESFFTMFFFFFTRGKTERRTKINIPTGITERREKASRTLHARQIKSTYNRGPVNLYPEQCDYEPLGIPRDLSTVHRRPVY